MSHVIDRAAWSPGERAEFEELLTEVCDASRDTTGRLNLMEELIGDAIQAHRPWASEVARSARREGFSREIKRHQDRQRALVAYDGRVLSVPAVQARRVLDEDGAVTYQRELIELWTWEELREKRKEAIKAATTYTEKIAHYDRLLMLGDLAPDSSTPAEAAESLGVDLGEWLGRAA